MKEIEKKTKKTKTPEEAAWFVSGILFMWMRPLFRAAQAEKKTQSALMQNDLIELPSYDHAEVLLKDFEESWQKTKPKDDFADDDDQKKEATGRLRKAVVAVMGRRFFVAGGIKVINTALQFSFPILLNQILKFIQESQAGLISEDASWGVKYRGYWLSALLFLAMTSKAITENVYFQRVYRSGYQARVAISVAVYNKALRISNSERQTTTLGELVNLMQVDATKIEMFIPQFHVLWDGSLQIAGYMAILYTLIGWPCFAGLGLMILLMPYQGTIMQKLFGLNRQMVAFTDERVKTTNEALQGMQSLKMFSWEENFAESIGKNRNVELGFLKKVAYLRAFSRAYMSALPGLVAVTSFIVYALAYKGAEITAATLFAALVAFDQLRFPLLFYPVSLAQLAQAKVSAARVQKFLEMKEVGTETSVGGGIYHRVYEGAGEIQLQNATIFWSDPNIPLDETQHSRQSSRKAGDSESSESPAIRYPKAILSDVSLQVRPGELCAVVGKVGSGKSTLCSAILNETLLMSGEVTLKGSVAYVSQTAWILNATLRDNILFGLAYDEDRYNQVIKVCQLEHDLSLLDDYDLTEIGEKGINLSGGQRQRVSIARACYSNAETIIFDDPLSALDPEVAKKLFDECIFKFLSGKTRLLMTNQLQFLQYCDSVIALGHGGVIEQGSYADLTNDEKSEVSRLLKEAGTAKSSRNEAKENDKIGEPKEKMKKAEQKDATALITKEERMMGAVPLSVYLKYIKAGGGYLKFLFVYIGFVLSAANGLAYSAWVTLWTSDFPEYKRLSEATYLGVYFVLALTLGLVTYFRAFMLARFGVSASETLHHNLLDSILRAPQSFFDTTPIGRILSRFSKDIYSIDIELTDNFDFFLFCSLQVIISLATIMFATPWFGVAILPLGFFYFLFLNYFREVSRETKRLDSISRSPVYQTFSETLGGLTTIRAYGQSERFMGDFEGKVDDNTRAYYNNKNADRWLSVRLEFIGSMITGLAAFFACNVVISQSATGANTNSNFASLAGLSLTQAIAVTGLLNWCVRTFAQLEAAMNACERVLYYTDNIPREAPRTCAELEEKTAKINQPPSPTDDPSSFAVYAAGGIPHVTTDWPQEGKIVLRNLKMRYRPETPLVLKGLNVVVSAGERVGVVGRTGSGKSSLLLSLLRLVEPALEKEVVEKYEAPIEIDGIDVLRIGLRDLRSRIGIIPQNPVLFSGTIRVNVDPFNNYTDEQIWDALTNCNMRDVVEEMGGLEALVSEYGENLSSGQRQMLVLGRALLRQNKVLLLDEATSNVDFETDQAIQKTLREAFTDCTVLTIAHRVNTIMDSDKILVMKDGLVAEFASPAELLQDSASIFSDIVRHAKNSVEIEEATGEIR